MAVPDVASCAGGEGAGGNEVCVCVCAHLWYVCVCCWMCVLCLLCGLCPVCVPYEGPVGRLHCMCVLCLCVVYIACLHPMCCVLHMPVVVWLCVCTNESFCFVLFCFLASIP